MIRSFFKKKVFDKDIIRQIKNKYDHEPRSFWYGIRPYICDSLYCHASPGTIEQIVLLLDKLKNGKNSDQLRLLNLGGGTGRVSDVYKHLGFDVINVDFGLESEDSKNYKIDLNSAINLPFSENYFDVIICQEIIEHLENPWSLIRIAKKYLKKEGTLIVSTPNVLSFINRINFLFTGFFKWFTPDCFGYHINPIPYWELGLILQKTGFKIAQTLGSGDYFLGNKKSVKKIILNNEVIIVEALKI